MSAITFSGGVWYIIYVSNGHIVRYMCTNLFSYIYNEPINIISLYINAETIIIVVQIVNIQQYLAL